MLRRALSALALPLLLSAVAAAQISGGYQDVEAVHVKPEKRAEFDAVCKKIAEANRRAKGYNWTASEVTYGEGNTVYFVSSQASYGDIEKGFDIFNGALMKAYGQAGAEKIFQDFNSTLVSERSEIRRRRWELSANPPADMADYMKRVAETRWVRTTTVHVRVGQAMVFESAMKDLKAALENANPPVANYVSEAVAGQHGTVFYIVRLVKSLSEFDGAKPLSERMGDEAYQKYLKAITDSVEGSETILQRLRPELSNPPEGVISASPDFWTPKPKPAAKPKAAEAAKPEAKQ
jgi:hypothetical protein